MARIIRQNLPDPPPVYDQAYISKLADAINRYMIQATAQAEVVAASYICTAPVIVDPRGVEPGSVPNTAGLPNGTLYLYPIAAPASGQPGHFYVSIVTENDV